MTDVNVSTGRTLRYGVILGLAILVAGLLISAVSQDLSTDIMTVGIAVIIFTPMVSIVVSAVMLYLEKDYRWFGWASVVLVITLVGLAVAYFY